MSAPENWIPHHREDGELVGWIVPEGEAFIAIDLLGSPRTPSPVDWLAAEELLDGLGIGYLADAYAHRVGDEWVRVRITEVSTDGIGVKEDDFGAIANHGIVLPRYRLPFPAGDDLVPLEDAPAPVRSVMG